MPEQNSLLGAQRVSKGGRRSEKAGACSAEDNLLDGGERVSKGRQRANANQEEVWSKEDIQEYMEEHEKQYGYGGSPDGDPEVNGGAVMVGLVLFSLIVFSLYSGKWNFALYNTVLLVILSIGSSIIN